MFVRFSRVKADDLRAKAAQCRCLAETSLVDDAARDLTRIAQEYELKAVKLDREIASS
jgi:hypothetical protein